MAVTLADFRTAHPEFSAAPDALVERCLGEAHDRVPENVWGPKRDAGIRYLAAHLITITPGGLDMRVGYGGQDKIGDLYDREFRRLKRSVAHGFRVTGDTSGIVL